jgi:two-component system, OmpR family, sensor histidine kinase KdpD
MGRVLVGPRSTVVAALGMVAVAVVCQLLHANATVAAIVLLSGVLAAGASTNSSGAVVVSLVGTLCLDYFFVPPIGAITIADPQGWIILIVFLAVSLFASKAAARLREQRDELLASQRETEKLHALSRAILMSAGEELRRAVVNKCMELFGLQEAVLYECATGQFQRSNAESQISDDKLRKVARYGSVHHELAPQITIIPITLGNQTFGSLGVRGASLPEASLQALANIIALGVAQAQAQEASSRAEAVRKGEELKSVMIDALAHELKTPLTAIEAAADLLLDGQAIDTAQRQELLGVVQQESRGLNDLVAQAMHLARIDAKRLKLDAEPIEVSQIISAAVQALGERAASHQIRVELLGKLPPVMADRELITLALKQLIDNAVKYSPPGSVVTVSATDAGGVVAISVRDQGQGLTELEQSRVFEKFYRGRYDRSAVQGTGMGLSIAKEISEAHGGALNVESQFGHGSRFTLTLRLAVETVAAAEQQA